MNIIEKLIAESPIPFPSSQRERLLKLAEKIGKENNHPTKPGKFNLEVDPKNTGETAAQRAIYNSKYAEIPDGKNITWIDMELPVVLSNNPRRRCLDIIGKDDNDNYYLVELKYGKNGDNPIYALLELLCYHLIIKDNFNELDKKKVWHSNKNKDYKFSWQSFGSDKTILAVAANKEYWEKYREKSSYSLTKNKSFFDRIKSEMKVKIQFFSFANLIEPVESAEKYSPSLENNRWEEIS